MKVWWLKKVFGILDGPRGTKSHYVNPSLFFCLYYKYYNNKYQDIIMSKDKYSPVVVRRNEYVTSASLLYLHSENKKNHKTGHSYKHRI